MSYSYTYSIADDFPDGGANTAKLHDEIQASSIVTALDDVSTSGDTLTVRFKTQLSSADKTTLDGDTTEPCGGLIAAHDNTPSDPTTQSVVIEETAEVVPWPATKGFRTWFTGAGDNLNPTPPASGVGDGQNLRLSFDGEDGNKAVDIQFQAPVELHDGEVFYSPVANWDMDDRFSFSVVMPATPYEEIPQGSSSSSSSGGEEPIPVLPYNTGLGYSILIPNHPHATHRVYPSQCVPVPTSNEQLSNTGYWDAEFFTGVVSPSAGAPLTNTGVFHLLNVQVEVFFLKNIPMGNPLGVFEVDVYKAEWVHPNWKMRMAANKQSSGVGEMAAWLMLFRELTS